MTKITLSEIGTLDAEVDRLIRLKLNDKPELSYKGALLAVAGEAPDLFRAKTFLLRRNPGASVTLRAENGRLVAVLNDQMPERTSEHARAAQELHELVTAKMKEKPELGYGSALKLVASEQPGLMRRARSRKQFPEVY